MTIAPPAVKKPLLAPLTTARWSGFAGAVLLGVAAYLGGALPVPQPAWVSPVTIWHTENGPASVVLYFAGVILLILGWWQARTGALTVRWVAVTAALWSLPLIVAPPLASRDVYPYSCQGEVFAAGIDPYRNGVAALPCEWLDLVTPMWRETPAPYGAVFMAVAGLVAHVTGTLWASIAGFRVAAVAGLLLAAVSLPALARRAGADPARTLWLGLTTPLVAIHLLSGAHNDALMIGLFLAGLAVTPRPSDDRTPTWWWRLAAAGALIGLSVGVKGTALVVLPFAALLALGAPFRWRALWPVAAVLTGGAVAALAGTTLAAGLDFGWLAALSSTGDSVVWQSPPTSFGLTIEWLAQLVGVRLRAFGAFRVIALVLLIPVLVAIWWHARHEQTDARVLHHAGLALAATLALSPVVNIWYMTWPIALLAIAAASGRGLLGLTVVTVAGPFLIMPDGTGLAYFTRIPGAPLMVAFSVWFILRLARRLREERRIAAA
ncbi:polyprenol phosphomannose-dependent alpha 1,6 mannosyltransferase MptB [Catenuloplanes atrovinosus]|uniref:Alpha-1,6-mannosyltransferase n=1 Tax=Catenuloplanes atrovinosus TaxID=137266 RepID=A0AAE3YTW8_9ACTN|nr:polyprenol phosphomannose-dependent alpha 1,6 mannosyltransferase MptB [Catenuloplanes atrovinosus]MDR7278328.1 alpha-1,6-mannosyltransferase [Catenuloplanes atrovinosus]